MINKQRGLGLIEVLAASLLVAIGAGIIYTGQQSALLSQYNNYRSMEALQMAKTYVDLSIQTIPTDSTAQVLYTINYEMVWKGVYGGESNRSCFDNVCNGSIITYELGSLTTMMVTRGYKLRVSPCPVNAARGCVYVLWGWTTGVEGSSPTRCVNVVNGRMVKNPGAQCVVLEGYVR